MILKDSIVYLQNAWNSKQMITEAEAAIPLEPTRRAFGNQEKSKQRSAIVKNDRDKISLRSFHGKSYRAAACRLLQPTQNFPNWCLSAICYLFEKAMVPLNQRCSRMLATSETDMLHYIFSVYWTKKLLLCGNKTFDTTFC